MAYNVESSSLNIIKNANCDSFEVIYYFRMY